MSDPTREIYEQRRQVRKLLSSTRLHTELWLQKYALDIWTARCPLQSKRIYFSLDFEQYGGGSAAEYLAEI